MVITGLDRLLKEGQGSLQKSAIGMVTNHTSVTHNLKMGIEELLRSGYNIKAIFGAEHGFRGNLAAGELVTDSIDERTGLKAYSLYGASKKPTDEMMEGLDALLFDMQDIGVRFYTYIYTMAYTMEAAAKHGLDYYVLDRPNPITGSRVEGNILEEAHKSFVGNYPIPLRHGMTIGELAQMFNDKFDIGCNLHIVTMEGWNRNLWYDETGLQWVMPSPNSTGMDMATLYPGTCLFEGTNVSEGRGTTRPFEMIGAPWINGERWAEILEGYGLEGVLFRPIYFTPSTSKHQGKQCQGVQVHVTDREQAKPLRVAFAMIESLKHEYPDDFDWVEPYNGRYFIDLLTGTSAFRDLINSGGAVLSWLDAQSESLQQFRDSTKQFLLY